MNKPTFFLDIDGVITATETSIFVTGFRCPSMRNFKKSDFDQNALGIIKKAVELSGADVVLCSTWGASATAQQVCILGATLGFSFAGVVDDDFVTDRPIMIEKYLKKHPEITNFAIIDDCVNWYKDTPLDPRVVRVNEKTGFTMENLDSLSSIIGIDLMKESSKDRSTDTYDFNGSELLEAQNGNQI